MLHDMHIVMTEQQQHWQTATCSSGGQMIPLKQQLQTVVLLFLYGRHDLWSFLLLQQLHKLTSVKTCISMMWLTMQLSHLLQAQETHKWPQEKSLKSFQAQEFVSAQQVCTPSVQMVHSSNNTAQTFLLFLSVFFLPCLDNQTCRNWWQQDCKQSSWLLDRHIRHYTHNWQLKSLQTNSLKCTTDFQARRNCVNGKLKEHRVRCLKMVSLWQTKTMKHRFQWTRMRWKMINTVKSKFVFNECDTQQENDSTKSSQKLLKLELLHFVMTDKTFLTPIMLKVNCIQPHKATTWRQLLCQ